MEARLVFVRNGRTRVPISRVKEKIREIKKQIKNRFGKSSSLSFGLSLLFFFFFLFRSSV